MSHAPLVSCIMPVFNGESHLAAAIDSVLAQNHRKLEVIVVDDGSTDGTAAIAEGFDDRVRYVRQSNAGPAGARNHGIRIARGDFLAFLDADDRWHPEKLMRQLARFRARPDLGISLGHVEPFWSGDTAAEAAMHRDHRQAHTQPAYSTIVLVAPRRIFDEVGAFDEDLKHASEAEWFLRAADAGVVVEMLPDVLAYWRLHEHNRTLHHAARSRDEHLRLLKAPIDRKRGNDQR